MKNLYSLLLLSCCLLLCACGRQEHFSSSSMTYADLLRIHEEEDWTVVEVLDAWHEGQVLHRYVLVPREAPLPDDLPEGTLVRTPLQRIVAFSAVHGGLFCDLNCADQMVGMCDVEYVQSEHLLQRLEDQRLQNAGSSMQVDLERVASLRPDAFFVSPFENAGYGAISALGIPLIECADYMETSALGRAEWMKFYGLLMGCENTADSLFSEVEKDYIHWGKVVEKATSRPTLLCDMKLGSAWYVPGGNSYIGRLFADAGANYIFADKPESGSIALAFEQVYAQGHEAEIWVVKYGSSAPLTYQGMVLENPLYAQFRPWKERRVYGCNTFSVAFYEEIPFHPNRLLKDMVKIFHPELLPDYQLQYYQPLSE